MSSVLCVPEVVNLYEISFPGMVLESMVHVYDWVEIDGMLGQRWETMKGFLTLQKVDDAVSYFNPSTQENYRNEFNYLKNNFDLPGLIGDMQDIELIYLKSGRAKYRIIREDQIIDGISETVTYYIYFSLDEKGLWKIEQF